MLIRIEKALNLMFHRADGLHIFSGSSIVAFLHFYQRHFLIHVTKDYINWKEGDTMFQTQHKGSFPRMWKATTQNRLWDSLRISQICLSWPWKRATKQVVQFLSGFKSLSLNGMAGNTLPELQPTISTSITNSHSARAAAVSTPITFRSFAQNAIQKKQPTFGLSKI